MVKTLLLVSIAALTLSACTQAVSRISNQQSIDSPQAAVEQETNTQAEDKRWIEQGKFSFDRVEHDFGIAKQSNGEVSTIFKVRYNGEEAITVTGLPTSCACTTAELSQMTFKPGDEAELTVTFNANLHPEPKERFFRTVSFNTEPKLDTSPEVKVWVEHIEDLGPEAYEIPVHVD